MNVTLDEATHTYRLDGRPIIGVTETIKGLGLDPNVGFYTPEARRRGRAVHAAIHYWLEDDLHWPSVKPEHVGYVRAAILLVETLKLEMVSAETIVVDETLGVAGKVDLFARYQGEPAIVDWQSGGLAKTKALQTAGYGVLARAGLYPSTTQFARIGASLHGDGTIARPEFYTSHRDERRFLAAVDLYRTFVYRPPAPEPRVAEEDSHVSDTRPS